MRPAKSKLDYLNKQQRPISALISSFSLMGARLAMIKPELLSSFRKIPDPHARHSAQREFRINSTIQKKSSSVDNSKGRRITQQNKDKMVTIYSRFEIQNFLLQVNPLPAIPIEPEILKGVSSEAEAFGLLTQSSQFMERKNSAFLLKEKQNAIHNQTKGVFSTQVQPQANPTQSHLPEEGRGPRIPEVGKRNYLEGIQSRSVERPTFPDAFNQCNMSRNLKIFEHSKATQILKIYQKNDVKKTFLTEKAKINTERIVGRALLDSLGVQRHKNGASGLRSSQLNSTISSSHRKEDNYGRTSQYLNLGQKNLGSPNKNHILVSGPSSKHGMSVSKREKTL